MTSNVSRTHDPLNLILGDPKVLATKLTLPLFQILHIATA